MSPKFKLNLVADDKPQAFTPYPRGSLLICTVDFSVRSHRSSQVDVLRRNPYGMDPVHVKLSVFEINKHTN